ncbi:MAG: precorrin-6y C5,15-methyltransferase (decarboxylating) subunit CbiE [Chloroflexi bacterium]|nr:precorrin-6y C5,15-methyltransferase (decarboxylating) subunit CbiE [Chloroflexota bacterium]
MTMRHPASDPTTDDHRAVRSAVDPRTAHSGASVTTTSRQEPTQTGRSTRRLLVVGIGDDGLDGLTPTVRARVAAAGLLVGARRHLSLIAEHPAERLTVTGDLNVLARRLAEEIQHRRVVVLASGDPCFFGIGSFLADRLGHERVEIVPAVSSVALAFARLGLGWQDARVVSAHGRPLDDAIRASVGGKKLAVLTDADNTPAVVAHRLLDAGAADADAWVFEHLGGPRERTEAGRLSEICRRSYARLNLLIVPTLTWPLADRRFGRPEADFEHHAHLITKPEVRAVTLSKLGLRDDGTLWDVGAGSGSVAVEAAGLLPGLRVYAVERSAEQIAFLEHNLRTLGRRAQVTAVQAEAPEALADLPDPSAVFVGGAGARLLDVLDTCIGRVAHGGRIVVNLITLERVGQALDWAKRRGLTVELVQIAVSRGMDVAGATRLDAHHPVFILTIERGWG